ncbi:MarR family transcriptional regulator [Streptomyces sporangiiformans]|uniref:MarR family transcriptional regulator n=1 Tax=Streptomyces sporangiiformans TaxID=2315329 RepID=A0A505D5H9_9ACTN|nr:MarR family transcriptional regulator [Streptomyces sporangiiformans]TPQ18067.1 MarR family transcriptional regulator [Streptomyces sporangiiformans]
MTTSTPTVDGRVIGLAHYAGRAVLERVLAGSGHTFTQFVTLRAAAVAGDFVERDRLVDGVTGALKIEAPAIQAAVDELTTTHLLEGARTENSRLRVTDAGRRLYECVASKTAEASARIYAGIPPEDLATAGRVLALVTERANAELART